jgi:acyl carrier protein
MGRHCVTEVADNYDPSLTVEQQVKKVFADKLGKSVDTIRLEDDLPMDLGFDSLSLAEMTVHIEKLAGVRMSGEDLFDANTVGDLIDLVSRSLKNKSSQS